MKIDSGTLLDFFLCQLGTGRQLTLKERRRYSPAISSWIELLSSPLVIFNFKTFPKHRTTKFLNFFAQI